MNAPLTLAALNAASAEDFVAWLDGVYEASPWVAEQAWPARPFKSPAHLKHALASVVRQAPPEAQLALLRAHPELAGKAMLAQQLSTDSRREQDQAGLTACSADEFATLQRLNATYQARFGWPFILAIRGPRGTGLTRSAVIADFTRRLQSHPDAERAECLRQVHRIAELRLNERLASSTSTAQGQRVWDWCEQLAAHSDAATPGELTVTYLSPAHQACTQQLRVWMNACGFDETHVDAVGNVVGLYHGTDRTAPRLMTGSHFDTVRNGGKYDGRLGILVPMACVQALHQAQRRLPFGIEVIGFAEEEGQRYPATFLGSGALTGQFDPAWLDQRDANGISMRHAMQAAGLPGTLDAITALRRDPAHYLGFVEIHIEQGPVLDEMDLPLGVVTSINGSVRYLGEVAGLASHAGTTPMNRRRDAATAVAELALYAESRASQDSDSVATVGQLHVPHGSINVVPGLCRFSLDLRAPTDTQRDRLVADVCEHLRTACERRGVRFTLQETLRVAAAPSDTALQRRWEQAVNAIGLPVHRMPSGAGHDAMKLHTLMPQAMLFVRGGNSGISHNPLETITSDDAQLCVDAFEHLLGQWAAEAP